MKLSFSPVQKSVNLLSWGWSPCTVNDMGLETSLLPAPSSLCFCVAILFRTSSECLEMDWSHSILAARLLFFQKSVNLLSWGWSPCTVNDMGLETSLLPAPSSLCFCVAILFRTSSECLEMDWSHSILAARLLFFQKSVNLLSWGWSPCTVNDMGLETSLLPAPSSLCFCVAILFRTSSECLEMDWSHSILASF